MVAPSIHATKSEIVSTVDSFNEETMTNLVMKTFLDTYQTYVKSVVDHSMINPDEMCESIIASEDSNIPNISNENEFRTSIYLQQSRNCRVSKHTLRIQHKKINILINRSVTKRSTLRQNVHIIIEFIIPWKNNTSVK